MPSLLKERAREILLLQAFNNSFFTNDLSIHVKLCFGQSVSVDA